MSADITYKTHILVGKNGVMTVIVVSDPNRARCVGE
jgi:hypothetical protein